MPDSFDVLPTLPTTAKPSRPARETRRSNPRRNAAVEPPPGTRAARGFRGMEDTWELLANCLEGSVPTWILELRDLTPQQRIHRANRAATTVASRGDILMFPSKKKGSTAAVFNELAEGLAAAAYQPGGVTAFDRHWCVDPHPGCPNRRRNTPPTADRTETV